LGAGAVVVVAAVLSPPQRLSAQAPAQFAGTVARIAGADTVAVAGARMQLHRVGAAHQGVIANATADARGRWRFRVTLEADANYLVSANHAGIEFFTPPLSTDPARPDTGVRIVVADTSSDPALRLDVRSRHLLIQGGDSSGWRGVVEVLVLENATGTTKVGADSLSPVAVLLLPPDAHEPELADGDLGPEAVRFDRGAVEIHSPIAPGAMSLAIQYLLPASATVRIPFADTVTEFNLLVDGEGSPVAGAPLMGPEPVQVEGREFRRWTAPVAAGMTIELDLRGTRSTPRAILYALIATMAVGLGASFYLVRRRGGLANAGGRP
jgi:hypothetical protein